MAAEAAITSRAMAFILERWGLLGFVGVCGLMRESGHKEYLSWDSIMMLRGLLKGWIWRLLGLLRVMNRESL